MQDLCVKEMAMPDLDQIKQGEQARATGAGGSPKVSPAILPGGPANLPTEPLGLPSCCSRSRPATSDRRSQLVETRHAGTAAGMYGQVTRHLNQ